MEIEKENTKSGMRLMKSDQLKKQIGQNMIWRNRAMQKFIIKKFLRSFQSSMSFLKSVGLWN